MEKSTQRIENTTLLSYDESGCEKSIIKSIDELYPLERENYTQWFNTYGNLDYTDAKKIILNNKLDDFLIKLLLDTYRNKVIELDNVLFVSIEVFRVEDKYYPSERMAFILNSDFVWSVQEKFGDYFEDIRDRLQGEDDFLRAKRADYLFFLILESIIDNYSRAFQKICDYNDKIFSIDKIKPTPELSSTIEDRKHEIFKFKKATKALRDTVTKLERTQITAFKTKYFDELKEQINNLMSDVDFELEKLESRINLIFSIQGNRLNEIMKTLTIFSIIFIPITFLAGIYGTNFKNMPLTDVSYGFIVLIAIMAVIAGAIVAYFKQKQWF